MTLTCSDLDLALAGLAPTIRSYAASKIRDRLSDCTAALQWQKDLHGISMMRAKIIQETLDLIARCVEHGVYDQERPLLCELAAAVERMVRISGEGER